MSLITTTITSISPFTGEELDAVTIWCKCNQMHPPEKKQERWAHLSPVSGSGWHIWFIRNGTGTHGHNWRNSDFHTISRADSMNLLMLALNKVAEDRLTDEEKHEIALAMYTAVTEGKIKPLAP